MGKRDDQRIRRRLALKRETLLKLSRAQLEQVAGGTWGCTEWPTMECDTSECWMGTTSRYC